MGEEDVSPPFPLPNKKLLKLTEVSPIFVGNPTGLAEKPGGRMEGGVRCHAASWETYLWVGMFLLPLPPCPLYWLSSTSALGRSIWGSVPSDPVKNHPGDLGLTLG